MPQSDLTISRAYFHDVTIGRVFSPHFRRYLASLELPWLGNASDHSCIPPGVYPYRVAPSPRLDGRLVIWIDNVPGRINIQIHPANYTKDILGCVAPGLTVADIDRDVTPDVTSSSDAHNYILEHIPSTGHIRFTDAVRPGIGVYS